MERSDVKIPASTSFSYRKLIFPQTVFVLDQKKKSGENLFLKGKKILQWGGREALHNGEMMYSQQCHLVQNLPSYSVFVHLTQKERGSYQSKETGCSFSSCSSFFLFFFFVVYGEETNAEIRMDGQMERHHITLLHLWHWWKPAGCLETGARTGPKVAMGTVGTWWVDWTQTSSARFEHARIDMSACLKKKE